ncbi:class I SAM-dependent methyltransferase [Actinomyces succiniciruminis]|uniref:Methyltransferase n=1 Tax=Actinomyces succiniciruminis TaxID=1522002 RepID=A0A1L7RKW4_9ACTO|nr:hypothetical protein [Actinomyces succiniciruminis]CED90780.1 Methyltransferase [Actinomyces succiniciruminis]
MKLLDIDTGDGEFLLSFRHPNHNTAATEGHPPDVELRKQVLLPLGIDFKEANGSDEIPFPGETFNIITNRHGAYDAAELQRTVKPSGLFLTQQVGAENDSELVQLLLPHITELPYPEQYLEMQKTELLSHGFEVLESGEARRPIRLFDVGTLVWFARIIDWDFPGFTVDDCLDQLYEAQEIIERTGAIEGSSHRFYIVARKKQ